MSDEPQVPAAEDPAPEAAPTQEKPAEKTFTEAEVQKLIQKRLGKFADYDELKAKAAKADEFEAANQTELEKAIKRAEEAEAKAGQIEQQVKAAERAALARDVAVRTAKEMGRDIDAALKWATKLDGDDEESLVASAKELFEALKTSGSAGPPQAVNDIAADPTEDDPFLKGFYSVAPPPKK